MALYKIYNPLTKYRLIVIVSMQFLLGLSLIGAHSFLDIQGPTSFVFIFIVCYSLSSIYLIKIITAFFIYFENKLFKEKISI